MAKKVKVLHRAKEQDSLIAGVCAGLAGYFNVDPTIVRLCWVFVSLIWGAGALIYLIFWVVVPRK